MKMRYSIYNKATGRLIGVTECRPEHALPEGDHPHNSEWGVIHAVLDEVEDVAVEGQKMRRPAEEIEADRALRKWRTFRERRYRFFLSTDGEMSIADMPSAAGRKNRLRQLRQELRDAPQVLKTPDEALARLDEIENG